MLLMRSRLHVLKNIIFAKEQENPICLQVFNELSLFFLFTEKLIRVVGGWRGRWWRRRWRRRWNGWDRNRWYWPCDHRWWRTGPLGQCYGGAHSQSALGYWRRCSPSTTIPTSTALPVEQWPFQRREYALITPTRSAIK